MEFHDTIPELCSCYPSLLPSMRAHSPGLCLPDTPGRTQGRRARERWKEKNKKRTELPSRMWSTRSTCRESPKGGERGEIKSEDSALSPAHPKPSSSDEWVSAQGARQCLWFLTTTEIPPSTISFVSLVSLAEHRDTHCNPSAQRAE